MRGTRTVYELLDECARDLPEPFSRAQVFSWFRRHHPEVAEGTVATHVQALTADVPNRERQHAALGRRPPLFERQGRGVYVRHRGAGVARPADIVLVGCVKTKLALAAPARDLFASQHFRAARAYAESTGLPWYVLSAKYGLLAPDEVIEPYDVFLKDMSLAYRRTWGEWVLQQLLRERGDLTGATFSVHAGEAYVAPLRVPLARLRADVVEPLRGLGLGGRTRWHQQHTASLHLESDDAVPKEQELEPADMLTQVLGSGRNSRSPRDFTRDRDPALDGPGLYTWWVDENGAADLTQGLGVTVEPGLIYAGQAGATRWPSGRRSRSTLRLRVGGMHLGTRSEFSTFRRTLAAALLPALGLASEDDPRLSLWMEARLRVLTAPVQDPDTLGRVERTVLEQLDPPLNLQHMPTTPVRQALRAARRRRGLSRSSSTKSPGVS